MSNWISVNDRLPELIDTEYGFRISKMVPVMFKWDRDDELEPHWRRGYLQQNENADYTKFFVDGVNGSYTVTHWYDLPECEVTK